MKVLHVLPYVPVPTHSGGPLRVFHLLNHLSRHHEVTVLSYGDAESEHALAVTLGHRLKKARVIPYPWARVYRRSAQVLSLCTGHSYFYYIGHSTRMQQAINEAVSSEHFDVIQTEFSTMASFDLPSESLKVLDAHNVEHDNFRRWALNGHTALRGYFYKQEFRKTFREEMAVCRRQDAMFVTSECDKKIFDEHLPDLPKYVIPNGVDPDYFRPGEQEPMPFSIVFTGMMAYVPNYDGMQYFLDEIFPHILREIPQAKVFIVGNRPPKSLTSRASDNVIVTGFVDDVRPYVWNAAVYIVPLRMGSGTRLKVLEAMAMKKPIVTTSIGSEGIDVTHGETALVADEPKAFAECVVELFRNPSLRHRLTGQGLDLVRSRYQWSVVGEQLDQAYQSLTSRHQSQTTLEARNHEFAS